jgi:alcohol dehydrogenase class IV
MAVGDFDIGLPFRVVSGAGSMERIGPLVAGLGERVLIGCGRTAMRKAGILGLSENVLREAGLDVVVFDQIESDPSTDTVDKGVALARESGADVFMGLGGGSALDATKAIAFLTDTEGTAAEHQENQFLPEKACLPVVAVPTTSGTGSEATKVAVMTNSETGIKRAVYSNQTVARLVVLDPKITRLMSPELTVETGLDALGHAVEGYLSTGANPIAEAAAVRAMQLVARFLPAAKKNGDDLEARGQMAIAALLGGLAICSGVGVGHEIAMAVGSFNHQPHGRLVGIVTPHCLAFNRSAAVEKVADIGRAMGFSGGGRSDEVASKDAVEGMEAFIKELLPSSCLAEVAVNTEDIDRILEISKISTNIKTNPRQLDDSLRRDLLRQCIEGSSS